MSGKERSTGQSLQEVSERRAMASLAIPGLARRIEELRRLFPELSEDSIARIFRLPSKWARSDK
jgi:hypothetical protein